MARWHPHAIRVGVGLGYVAAWAGLALVAALLVFTQSSRAVTIAGHDAVLRPDLDGYVVLRTGPVLPDVRLESGYPLGVDITLGKTDARSTEALLQRYALIASQPDGTIAKIREAVADMALDAALRGAVLGLVPVLVWALLGGRRRRELLRRAGTRDGALALALALAMVVTFWEPWDTGEETVEETRDWVPLADFVGPAVPLPAAARGLEVRGDVTTSQTRRLVESAVDSFRRSKTFYAEAAEAAAGLTLHTPAEDETVVVLVSDRHLNVGMDPVARAIGDAAGASAVFDAGDDTSTGRTWEAFSLDSVTAAFDDGPYADQRWGVAGNHDHGTFVRRYLASKGWQMLDGEVVEGPGGASLLGVDDPRTSGLGNWRDESGLTFAEVGERLADAACEHAETEGRIGTILVHDANLGRAALERGCADLVVGGHLHVQRGPERVVGENGSVGYSYTTGTTGGAAYAIAIGSKIRRNAQVSLITYRDGRPVGIQGVELLTDGRFRVGRYTQLAVADAP